MLFCTVLVITECTIQQCKYFIKSFRGGFRQKAELNLSTVTPFSKYDSS